MRFFFVAAVTLFFVTGKAQPRYNANLLDTLQEIAQSNTPAKHFAQLYYKAIEKTNSYAVDQPEDVKAFVFGFESKFAPTFFQSYRNYIDHRPQVFPWQQYYADTSLNAMQYKFIGINAHINGDMWMALKDKYGYDTLKKYSHSLIDFQKALNVFFDSVYHAGLEHRNIKRLHQFSFGTDKIIGKQIVLHWRKRQAKMAMLFYSDPKKAKRKLKHLKKRMQYYDRLALSWIN